MSQPAPAASVLPLPLPSDPAQRLVLVAIRRMASGGIRDAHAASLFLRTFGLHFRKPLVLMRAFMVETARASAGTIRVAPCCAHRMTLDEARMVGIVGSAASNPANAADHLRALTGSRDIGAPLSAAAALGDALAECGLPLVI